MKVNLCYKEVRERCQFTRNMLGQTVCVKTNSQDCPAREIEKRNQKREETA